MQHNKRQPIPLVAAGVIQPPKRTVQDLLAERRHAVLELKLETDPTARELLQFNIDQIDREVHARTVADAIGDVFAATRAAVTECVGGSWSPAHHARRAA